jgi:hypothetical protein
MHEEDILALIEGLSDGIENLITVDRCSLRRRELIASTIKTNEANLSSECLIRWVTIDAKD